MPRSSTWTPRPFRCTSGGSTSTTPPPPRSRTGGLDEFLQHIASRLHLAPSARERLAFVPLNLDHPYWISDPNFDLEYHVRHVALPKPGDWTQLMRLAGRLHSLPLDMTRPLWEFWLVEGLDAIPGLPAGSYSIIWKLHHAAADALGSTEILSVLHDTEPDVKPMAAVEPWVADREPGQLELLIRAQLNNLRQPFRIAQLIGEAVPALRRLRDRQRVQRVEKPKEDLPVPRTRFNGRIRAPRRVVEAQELRSGRDPFDQETRRREHRERRRRRDRRWRSARIPRAPR